MGSVLGSLNCASGMASGEKDEFLEKDSMLKNRFSDERERELLQKLKECLSLLEEPDCYSKEEPKRSQRPAKVPEGQHNKVTNDDDNKDTIYKQNIDEQIERMENFLRLYKETDYTPPSLKEMLTVCRFVINMSKDMLEKDIKSLDDMNNKTVVGQSENKMKRSRSIEKNKINTVQHQNKTTEEKTVSAKVQLLYIQDSDTTQEILRELQQMLTQKIGSVDFIHLKEKSKVDENMLLIIMCIITTRVGADASYTVENIKNRDNVALLLIHITEPHAVSNKKSSHHLTEQDFAGLQGIFDMSFSRGNGFLPCEMNDKSVDGLSSFCKRIPNEQQNENAVKEEEIEEENKVP